MDGKLYPYTRKDVQTAGWQITTFGIPSAWAYAQGEGVTVGVLDTGCDLQHPDLHANLLEGQNFINIKESPQDDNDHGTHVSGCICAVNNDFGVVGVAPKAKIIPIKVLDEEGSGDLKTVAKGIYYGIERGADIMCISIGCGKPLAYLRKSIKAAANKGIPIFCAGGNVCKNMDVLYPARYPETIAIGALTMDFRRADFSNTAKQNIDFLAPGVEIYSTVRGGYAALSGSSMAVPFAVGVAALLLSAKKHKKTKVKLSTVEDYRAAFRHHGTDLGRFTDDKIFGGYGIIDPKKLIEWLKTSN